MPKPTPPLRPPPPGAGPSGPSGEGDALAAAPAPPQAPPPGPPRRQGRFLCNLGSWLIGVPVGLVLSAALLTAWAATHPSFALAAARRATGQELPFTVGETSMDPGTGWTAPASWSWHVALVELPAQVSPRRPAVRIEGAVFSIPRPLWSPNGWIIHIPRASVEAVNLAFPPVIERAPEPGPAGPGRLVISVERLDVGRFDMTMAPGLNPQVAVHASGVVLTKPLWFVPDQRSIHASLDLESASAEVEGIVMDHIRPSRIEFTGDGLEVAARGALGAATVDATLSVAPLSWRPAISARAELHRGTLESLANSVLGPAAKMELMGTVSATVTLEAGGAMGPGKLKGTATIQLDDAGFARPESKKAAVVIAVTIAPFLRFDENGDVVVGDFHGDVSFSERGVSFDTITYEARHSVGELRGYVHGEGLSAKLHFRPRPGGGAIEWGLILRGSLRKPHIALALPAVLRAWTPCQDPSDCALRGGAASGNQTDEEEETEKALEEGARDAAKAKKDAEHDAEKAERERERDAYKAAREQAHDDKQAEHDREEAIEDRERAAEKAQHDRDRDARQREAAARRAAADH